MVVQMSKSRYAWEYLLWEAPSILEQAKWHSFQFLESNPEQKRGNELALFLATEYSG